MLTLSESAIIQSISRGEVFSAQLDDGSLILHINDYQPFIATALHNGSRLAPSLLNNCQLSEAKRYSEEDPFTGEFIASLPIVIQVEDSRYEYDLNRDPDNCIYDVAWGEKVWSKPLPPEQQAIILRKHYRYYSILKVLLEKLEDLHGFCVLYDVHSYNYKRIDRAAPVFNLGTKQVNGRKWGNDIRALTSLLNTVTLPNLETTVGVNDVFQGMGYQAYFVKQHFQNTLCIPLEIKKIYMDELSGESFPLVIEQLKTELKRVITQHISGIIEKRKRRKAVSAASVLPPKLEKEVKVLDTQLYRLAKNLETLSYINPINLKQERTAFLKKPHTYLPQFRYRQLDIDPFLFKEKLYRLPVDDIRDAGLQTLYRKVIEQLAKRIDLLTSIGSEEFLYNSLRYYGQPSDDDIDNARFILHSRVHDEEKSENYSEQEIIQRFRYAATEYGIKCKVVPTDKIVAGALVNGKTLKVNPTRRFGKKELQGLIDHEMGIHIVTSANADKQPLKVFKLGLPGNTHTQEGLAILAEHLGGNLSISRLHTLALRVIAVNLMVHGNTFNQVYQELLEKYQIRAERAFTITARVFRGGGFTKDYLYLSGLSKAIQLYQQTNLEGLLIGKTSFEYLDIINELIARGILPSPTFKPIPFLNESPRDMVIDYLLSSIR